MKMKNGTLYLKINGSLSSKINIQQISMIEILLCLPAWDRDKFMKNPANPIQKNNASGKPIAYIVCMYP